MAGISPIRIADPVNWLTKSGITVMNEAKPRAAPKKAPSMTLTAALNRTWLCGVEGVLLSLMGAAPANLTSFKHGCPWQSRYPMGNPQLATRELRFRSRNQGFAKGVRFPLHE